MYIISCMNVPKQSQLVEKNEKLLLWCAQVTRWCEGWTSSFENLIYDLRNAPKRLRKTVITQYVFFYCNSQYFNPVCVLQPCFEGLCNYHYLSPWQNIRPKTTHVHRIMCVLVCVLRLGLAYSCVCVCGRQCMWVCTCVSVCVWSAHFQGKQSGWPLLVQLLAVWCSWGVWALRWPKGLQRGITACNTISSTHHQNTRTDKTLEGQTE